MGNPERYGVPEGCNPFIINCSILFTLQPHTVATERSKGHLVAPLTLEVEEKVKAALETEPGPSSCPPD